MQSYEFFFTIDIYLSNIPSAGFNRLPPHTMPFSKTVAESQVKIHRI